MQSHSDETNRTRLHEAIVLLDQTLKESDATKPFWANRNQVLDAIRL